VSLLLVSVVSPLLVSVVSLLLVSVVSPLLVSVVSPLLVSWVSLPDSLLLVSLLESPIESPISSASVSELPSSAQAASKARENTIGRVRARTATPDCTPSPRGNAEGASARRQGVRAKFDPSCPIARPIARPAVVSLAAPRIAAARLLVGEFAAEFAGEALVVEIDALDVDTQRLADAIAELQRREVIVHAAFTLGHDHDDERCFDRLVAWVEANRIAGVELRLWTPKPGSDEARALARAGRIRHLDYARWDGAHVIVEPAAMAPETLQRGWAWAQQRLGSLGSILRRRPSGALGWRQVFALLAPRLSAPLARPSARTEALSH